MLATRTRRLLAAVSLVWLGHAPAALAQTQGAAQSDAIVVTGRSAEQTQRFVDQVSIAPSTADQLARWDQEICTSVVGLPQRPGQFLADHGCMAYRMACQHADLVGGIASLAGQSFTDPALCLPSQPVNILHIHGTADEYVPFGPGPPTAVSCSPTARPTWPGVVANVQTWAGYNGSRDPVADAAPSLDLTTDVAGLDTVVTRYSSYPPGGAVVLWTINGGSHITTLSSEFSPRVIDWLLAHPKT